MVVGFIGILPVARLRVRMTAKPAAANSNAKTRAILVDGFVPTLRRVRDGWASVLLWLVEEEPKQKQIPSG
jgi:hypothetical protein